MIGHFHGAMTRVRPSDMAFPLRERGYEVVQWVNALRDNLQPFSHGLNANALSDTSSELVRAAYGPNYARLVELKKKYDPTNMLRLNPNIRLDKPSNN